MGRRVAVRAALVAAAIGASTAAAASHRHHASSHHAAASHHGPSPHHGKAEKKAEKPRVEPHHAGDAPKGVLSVPASGIKLFCGPGKNPLMVRKATQGNGSTVTVICR